MMQRHVVCVKMAWPTIVRCPISCCLCDHRWAQAVAWAGDASIVCSGDYDDFCTLCTGYLVQTIGGFVAGSVALIGTFVGWAPAASLRGLSIATGALAISFVGSSIYSFLLAPCEESPGSSYVQVCVTIDEDSSVQKQYEQLCD